MDYHNWHSVAEALKAIAKVERRFRVKGKGTRSQGILWKGSTKKVWTKEVKCLREPFDSSKHLPHWFWGTIVLITLKRNQTKRFHYWSSPYWHQEYLQTFTTNYSCKLGRLVELGWYLSDIISFGLLRYFIHPFWIIKLTIVLWAMPDPSNFNILSIILR